MVYTAVNGFTGDGNAYRHNIFSHCAGLSAGLKHCSGRQFYILAVLIMNAAKRQTVYAAFFHQIVQQLTNWCRHSSP
jgi:hypothetical protein